jgi:hypothetical protein
VIIDWQRDPDLGRIFTIARWTPRQAALAMLDQEWWQRVSTKISPAAQSELREMIRRRALADRPQPNGRGSARA